MFYQNPSSGSRVVPCGKTDRRTDRQTDMKLIVAFRNFANASRNYEINKRRRSMEQKSGLNEGIQSRVVIT